MALRTGFDPDGEMTSWVVNRSSGWIANGALNQSFLPVQILVNNVHGWTRAMTCVPFYASGADYYVFTPPHTFISSRCKYKS